MAGQRDRRTCSWPDYHRQFTTIAGSPFHIIQVPSERRKRAKRYVHFGVVVVGVDPSADRKLIVEQEVKP